MELRWASAAGLSSRGWWRAATLLALASVIAAGCGSDPASAPSTSAADDSDDRAADDDDAEDDGDDAPPSPEKTPVTKDASSASARPKVDAGSNTPVAETPKTADDTTPSDGWCEAKAVFEKYCTGCHDGKGSGGSPMGLTSYDELVAADPGTKGKKVFEVVGTRIHDTAKPMPPKKQLSAAELAVLDSWVAAGAPRPADATCKTPASGGGEPAKTPGEPVDGWDPTQCDAVYKITANGGSPGTPLMVPAGQETHPQVQVDAPWGTEPVQAINFHPITDNKKVLHHWILYSGSGAFLTGWAPGDDERSPLPADVGMDMPTGAGSMRLDMHYFNVEGKSAEPDQSGLEVCVLKKAHFRKNSAAVTMSLSSFGPVLAPANRKDYESTGTCNVTTTQPVHLLTASPHAHKYATRMKFWVKKRDGSQVMMHDHIFTFGEQGSYPLEPEVIVESGDTIYTTCVYTNDTSKNITFGESTTNEMCFNFAVYYPKGALGCGGLGGLLGR